MVIETSDVDALAQLVPALSVCSNRPGLLDLPTSPEVSHQRSMVPDPTPRPALEGLSYFHDHPPSPCILALTETLPSADGGVDPDVQRFIHALSHMDRIRQASTAKFLDWRRPTPADMSSSHHSHESSSAASGFEASPIMPTVARAQGGGEWEANLSRRLAKRRQTQIAPSTSTSTRRDSGSGTGSGIGSGKRRGGSTQASSHNANANANRQSRRRTKAEAENCGPLFPFVSPSDPFGGGGKRAGLGDLLESTFGGLRRRWKWGIVAAAAVALVVGWNWAKGA